MLTNFPMAQNPERGEHGNIVGGSEGSQNVPIGADAFTKLSTKLSSARTAEAQLAASMQLATLLSGKETPVAKDVNVGV